MRIGATNLSTKKTVLAGIALASVLLLSTGCAPDTVAGGGSGGGAGGSGSSSDSDSNDNNKDNKDSDGNSKDSKDADGNKKDSAKGYLTGKDCFTGKWLANNKDFERYMQAEAAAHGASIKTTGSIILAYNTDGTTQTNYDHWTNTVKVEGAKTVIDRHGVDRGTYTVSDNGTFNASDTSIGSVSTMTTTGPDGQIMSISVDPEPSVFNSGTYTCTGDLLTITVDGYNLTLLRK